MESGDAEDVGRPASIDIDGSFNDDLLVSALVDSEDLTPIIKAVYRRGLEKKFVVKLEDFQAKKAVEISDLCYSGYKSFVISVEKLLEVQPTLTELGESLTDIIDRVEEAGKETVSIINRNRELQTQAANLAGCRRVLTETIAILDLVQQGHDAVTEGKFHGALRTLRVVKRLRLRSLCTVGFGLYIEKRLPLLVDRLFAATLQSLHSWLTLAREKCSAIGTASLAAAQGRKQVEFSTSATVVQPHLNMDLTPLGDTVVIESAGLTFGPLMQALHVHSELGRLDEFIRYYSSQRDQQLSLLLQQPSSNITSLGDILAGICGFFVVEEAVLSATQHQIPRVNVDSLWDIALKTLSERLQSFCESITSSSLFQQLRASIVLFCSTLEEHLFIPKGIMNIVDQSRVKYLSLLLEEVHEDVNVAVCKMPFIPLESTSKSCSDIMKLLLDQLKKPKKEPSGNTFATITSSGGFSATVPKLAQITKSFLFDYFVFVKDQLDVVDLMLGALNTLVTKIISEEFLNLLDFVESPSTVQQAVPIQVVTLASINASALVFLLRHFTVYALELCSRMPHLSSFITSSKYADDYASTSSEARVALQRVHKRCESESFSIILRMLDSNLIGLDALDWAPDKSPTHPNAFVPALCRLMSETSSALQEISTAARDIIVEVLCQHASARLIFFLSAPSIKRFNMHGIQQMQMDATALENAANQLPTPRLKVAFAQNHQFVDLFLHNQIDDIANPALFKQHFPALEIHRIITILEKYVESSGWFSHKKGVEEPTRRQIETLLKKAKKV